MCHERQPAVLCLGSRTDMTSMEMTDALMSQTDTENRKDLLHQDVFADTEVFGAIRSPRSG